MKPVAVPPPLEHSAAEGVHDEHVFVAHDVLLDGTGRRGKQAQVPFEIPHSKQETRVGELVGSCGWMDELCVVKYWYRPRLSLLSSNVLPD